MNLKSNIVINNADALISMVIEPVPVQLVKLSQLIIRLVGGKNTPAASQNSDLNFPNIGFQQLSKCKAAPSKQPSRITQEVIQALEQKGNTCHKMFSFTAEFLLFVLVHQEDVVVRFSFVCSPNSLTS